MLLAVLAAVVLVEVVLTATVHAAPQPSPGPSPAPSQPAPGPTTPGTPPADPGTPSPAPAPTTPPHSDNRTPAQNPGDSPSFQLTNPVTGAIISAINEWIAGLATPMVNPVFDTIAATVLVTPDVAGHARVGELWGITRAATNTVFVVFILAAAVLVTSKDTLQIRTGVQEVAPRLVVALIAANTSLMIAGTVIDVGNALTLAVAGQGIDPVAAKTAIAGMLDNEFTGLGFLIGALRLAIVVMGIAVLVTFAARVMLTVLLIIAAPLMLMCHALPQTEMVAFLWWRSLAGLLCVQLGQSLVLVAFLRLYLTPQGSTLLGIPTNSARWVDLLVLLCVLWLMLAIPLWVRKLVFRAKGPGVVSRLVRTLFVVKTLGAVVGVGRHARHAPRSSAAHPHRDPGRHPGVRAHPRSPSTRGGTPGPQPGTSLVAASAPAGSTAAATSSSSGTPGSAPPTGRSRMGPARDARGWRYITPDGRPAPAPRTAVGAATRALPPGSSRVGPPRPGSRPAPGTPPAIGGGER